MNIRQLTRSLTAFCRNPCSGWGDPDIDTTAYKQWVTAGDLSSSWTLEQFSSSSVTEFIWRPAAQPASQPYQALRLEYDADGALTKLILSAVPPARLSCYCIIQDLAAATYGYCIRNQPLLWGDQIHQGFYDAHDNAAPPAYIIEYVYQTLPDQMLRCTAVPAR